MYAFQAKLDNYLYIHCRWDRWSTDYDIVFCVPIIAQKNACNSQVIDSHNQN